MKVDPNDLAPEGDPEDDPEGEQVLDGSTLDVGLGHGMVLMDKLEVLEMERRALFAESQYMKAALDTTNHMLANVMNEIAAEKHRREEGVNHPPPQSTPRQP